MENWRKRGKMEKTCSNEVEIYLESTRGGTEVEKSEKTGEKLEKICFKIITNGPDTLTVKGSMELMMRDYLPCLLMVTVTSICPVLLSVKLL